MMEIFLVQFLAAGLGAASTALADYSYRTARINQRAHSLWIATSNRGDLPAGAGLGM